MDDFIYLTILIELYKKNMYFDFSDLFNYFKIIALLGLNIFISFVLILSDKNSICI